MTTIALSTSFAPSNSVADTALRAAARFWFVVAVAGQWMFAWYVAVAYGGPAISGHLERWNQHGTHRYVPGDLIGNLAIGIHLLLAVIVSVGGPLQLIPGLRRYAPKFHRWNGRAYLIAVVLTSIAAIYLVWVRGTVGDLSQHLGVTLDAVLILIFAVLAVRYAIARDLRTHRRWALRLFMAVNGVWFFRVGMMLWLVLNHGPAGFDPKTFTGPFLTIWSFGNYLLPLAILELYLRTGDRSGPRGRVAMASGLAVITIAMGAGIVLATMVMWLPRIR